MAKETAEQKLLKLIEATQAKDGGAPSAPKPAASAITPAAASPEAARVLAAVQGVGVSSEAMPAGVKNIVDNLRNLVFSFRSPQSLGLNELNKIFIVVIIFMTIYLTMDFMRGMRSAREGLSSIVGSQDFTENMRQMAGNVVAAYKDMAEYAAIIAARNIFQPFEKKVEVPPEEAQAEAQAASQEQISAKLANFRIVGVSWLNSQDSVTVMIEDKQTQVTHFLKQGEEIQGVKVETIYADGVLVSFAGQTMTMRL